MKSMVFVVVVVVVAAILSTTTAVEVMIPMRDGVRLHTMFDFPIVKSLKNLTAVLDRSPYGDDATERIADIYLLFGFVAVRQDMRGTKQSEGKFTLWHNAANDSYDTMKFIAAQEWSNGQVLTVGASADGIASFCDPLDMPPWLKAQMIVFATSQARNFVYPGGAYRLELTEKWLNGTVPTQAAGLIKTVKEHEGADYWWQPVNATGQYWRVQYPSVMWAGWYDIFLNGNLAAFYGYQYETDPKYRRESKIVIDPLGHCQDAHKYFPKNLIEGRVILPLLLSIDLFEGIDKPAEDVKDVTFYVMGAFNDTSAPGNYWTTLDDFPTYTPQYWFMHADGSLSTTPPTNNASSSSSYKYDPSSPVPTVGGNNLELKCGPLDQSVVEKRSDVLVFTSAPLPSPLALTGPLTVRAWVSSSAVDTDFTAKLTDVTSDGRSSLIQDGIVRMRWLDYNAPTSKPIVPNQVYEVEISLWNTSFVFAEGHRIRVDISSSNYPRFSANPNTGIPLSQPQKPGIVAVNTLFHDASRPSQIILPVVQLAQLPDHGVLLTRALERRAARIQQVESGGSGAE